MSGWIPCSKELPDVDVVVMTFSPDSSEPVWPAFFDGADWEGLDGFPMQMEVTHWQNFPDPPNGGD